MKKVLHIINGEFFAGAERVQDLLALRLPEFDYSCGFICIKDGVFAKHRRSDGPIDVIPMRSKFDFSIINRISKIAKEGNYELLHTHTTRSALIGRFVAKRLHLPLVHHIHSPTQRDTDNLIKNSLNAFLENKFVLPSADHLVAVSSSLKTYVLERGVHESKVTVVRNGVPVVRDTPAWIAPTGDWTIGIVALFRPRKGIEVLLHTMRKLLDLGCPVRLKAVGTFETPQYEALVMALVSDLGLANKIEWTGFKNDVHREMETMHAFILPSLFGEGLPMVLIEAMSVGIPVIASRIEGIPEVISSRGVGLLVQPDNVDDLVKAIQMLINGEVSVQSVVTVAHARQKVFFSDISMATSVASVYDRLFT